jgi:hypothetical protein
MGPGLYQYAENAMNGEGQVSTFTNPGNNIGFVNNYTPSSSIGSSHSHHGLPGNGAASLGLWYFGSSDDSLLFTNHSLPGYGILPSFAPSSHGLPSSGTSLGQRYTHSFSTYDNYHNYQFAQNVPRDIGYAATSTTHHHGVTQHSLELASSETGPLGQEYTDISSAYGQSATGFGVSWAWEEVNYWTDRGYGSAHIAEVYSMNLLTEDCVISEEFVDWNLARTKEYGHLYK